MIRISDISYCYEICYHESYFCHMAFDRSIPWLSSSVATCACRRVRSLIDQCPKCFFMSSIACPICSYLPVNSSYPNHYQACSKKSFLAFNLLPRRSFSLSDFRARSACPAFDRIPHVPRRLASIFPNHSASTTTGASTLTTRQPSEHATSSFTLLLLVQTRSLSRAHLLCEEILLIACRVAGGY